MHDRIKPLYDALAPTRGGLQTRLALMCHVSRGPLARYLKTGAGIGPDTQAAMLAALRRIAAETPADDGRDDDAGADASPPTAPLSVESAEPAAAPPAEDVAADDVGRALDDADILDQDRVDDAVGEGGPTPAEDTLTMLARLLEDGPAKLTPGQLEDWIGDVVLALPAPLDARGEATIQGAARLLAARSQQGMRIIAKMIKQTYQANARAAAAAAAAFAKAEAERPPTPDEVAAAEAARAQEAADLWAACRGLAEAPDIPALMIRTLAVRGAVGEEMLFRQLLLCATSRLFPRPMHMLVTGPSSSGKSTSAERVLALLPEDQVYKLTSASAKALVYDEADLRHRVLYLIEATPLQNGDEVNYLALYLRSIISEGRIVHKVTETDPHTGARHTATYVVEGPIALVVTSTSDTLGAELDTRVMLGRTDGSVEQTRTILAAQAALDAGCGDPVADDVPLEAWHALQRWLALGERRVVIPFAPALVRLVRPTLVRFRRDLPALSSLVRAHALLHRATRAVDAEGRVVATLADYAAVRGIVDGALAESTGKRPPALVVRLVEKVRELLSATPAPPRAGTGRIAAPVVAGCGEVTVPIRSLAADIGMDKMAAHRALHHAVDAGYLVNRETVPRKPARLAMGATPLPGEGAAELPTAEELAATWPDEESV